MNGAIKDSWFSMAKNETGDAAEVNLFGDIGGWGVNAAMFHEQLKALGDVKKINLNIHSRGGSVMEGTAIHNILAAHPAEITAKILGIAASMATVIPCAAKTTIMPANTYMVIHNPFMETAGDAEELRKDAKNLDLITSNIVDIYAKKTKLGKKEIREMMDAETWMTAKMAKEKGFCDEVADACEAAAALDLSPFKNIPEGAKCFMKKTDAATSEATNAATPSSKPENAAPKGAPAGVPPAGSAPAAMPESPAGAVEGSQNQTDADMSTALVTAKAQIDGLNATLKERDGKITALEASLTEKQGKLDKAYGDLNESQAKLSKLVAGGFRFEPDNSDEEWAECLEKCGGDYIKARKEHKAAYQRYMAKHLKVDPKSASAEESRRRIAAEKSGRVKPEGK